MSSLEEILKGVLGLSVGAILIGFIRSYLKGQKAKKELKINEIDSELVNKTKDLDDMDIAAVIRHANKRHRDRDKRHAASKRGDG